MTKAPRLAWFAWIAVCLIWGTTYLGIRVALESIPPALMAGFRWTIAGTILATVVLARGGSLPPRRTWPGFALMGLLMIGFGNGFVVWAEQFVPSGLTAVVIATSPFWMVSSEAAFGGDRLGRGAFAGLIVGFAGIVLLVWPDLTAGGAHAAQFAGGIVALQLASAGWAAGSSFAKRHKQDDIVAATAMQMLFGGVLMLSIGTLAGEWQRLAFTPRTAGALTYLTLAGSLGAFLAYIYALRHLPVSTVSLYAYINPIIAVVLGALLLGEPFGSRVIAAAALVLAGLALVRYASAHHPGQRTDRASSTTARRRPILTVWSGRIRRRTAAAR
jgi:drug/metabolite transporter (DMT)-like permease